MPTYKTPGVYVEEISTLPPSVAEVSTAVPAFIGYTESGGPAAGESPVVARVNTLLEAEERFGGPSPSHFTVPADIDPVSGQPFTFDQAAGTRYLMYYGLSHYFKNGGGSCYVVSIGSYEDALEAARFENGLARLEIEDEPTLIVLADAVQLPVDDYYSLCQAALAQCNKLGDRFAVLDVKDGDVASFRDKIGTNYLRYGAAYHPYLQTTLSYRYDDPNVTIEQRQWKATVDDLSVSFVGWTGDDPTVEIAPGTGTAPQFEITARQLVIRTKASTSGDTTLADVVTAWEGFPGSGDPAGFDIAIEGDDTTTVSPAAATDLVLDPANVTGTLAAIRSTRTALYQAIKAALTNERVILPPSSTLAGIYASVDRDRGVWKAPANVSLSSVIGPVSKISHDEQEGLNVDPGGGKSINAIRAFTGKGTLVWGARTLAGNDNEWRYISVRRLFNTIEESAKKSTSFAVFEPNDATTWLKVKGMIEGYLFGLWERGALAGPTPEAAYFVNVGLGKTMTPQDVLEGRMIVEIGIAAVRPAEYIILRFTHKLQEA